MCYCHVASQDCGHTIESSRVATSLHRSKPSTHIYQLTSTIVMGENAMPQIRYKIEHPQVGLIHLGLIHGRYASQRMGLVATSPITHKQ